MKLIFCGDIHGKIALAYSLLPYAKDDIIVQLGDFGALTDASKVDSATDRHGRGEFPIYYRNQIPLPCRTYFIKGNHEDYDLIEQNPNPLLNLTYLPNGSILEIGKWKMAALGGNYAAAYYDGTKKPQGLRKRHFLKTEVEGLFNKDFNILLMHDPPDFVEFDGMRPRFKIPLVNELIQEKKPEYLFFGHMHRNYKNYYGNTLVVGLDQVPHQWFYYTLKV